MWDEDVRKFLFENDVQDMSLILNSHIHAAREFIALCQREGNTAHIPIWVVKVAFCNVSPYRGGFDPKALVR